MGSCMTPGMECINCLNACWDECGASQECKDAIAALNQCAETHGCDVMSEDETCLDENCCEEGKAAY